MPQAMPVMGAALREGKKRRGYEAALSPRSSPPTRTPMAAQERLPPIRSLLPDIPDRNDRALRTPMRQDATGPRPAIPARLSPPPLSRRSHAQSSSDARSPKIIEERSPDRHTYDSQPAYQLPIHSGPPQSRSSYSPSTLGSAPVSPYSTTSTDTRRYTNGNSQNLPPPPTPYQSSSNGRATSYALSGDYRNGESCYGGSYHNEGRSRDTRSAGPPSYQSQHHTYPSAQYSSYPPRPPPTNGNYPVHRQYSSSYHHGSVQFESDDSSGQAPRRRRGNLPRDTTDLLKQWFADHLGHPYPTEDEKQMLCRQTGLQMTQISNWFINARRRRIPELVNQATAETRLRENSGESSGSSE